MISAIIPWRSRPVNSHAFRKVHDHVSRLADEVILADDGGTPFSRAASINAGVRQARGTMLWICDADLILPAEQLDEGLLVARNFGSVVLPFDRYYYHSRVATRGLIKGRVTLPEWLEGEPERVQSGSVGGTCLMVRDTWEIVGGFDGRMRGWGHEDIAFHAAAQTFAAVDRVPGVLHHLWHPADPNRPRQNSELADRYVAAEGDPVAMDELIGER